MAAELVQIPSLVLDAVSVDTLDATRASLTSDSGPFTLADGDTLVVDTDTSAGVVITFNAIDFGDIAEATAVEVAAAIANGLATDGGDAEVDDDAVRMFSTTYGAASSLEVTGGTGAVALGFPSGAVVGADPTTQRLAINLYPEPDEEEVPLDASIVIDVFDSSGTAPGASDIEITVDGVVAFTGGAFTAGFLGAGSAVTLLDAATRRVVIDPTADFDSSALIDVQVESGTLTDSWSFIAADTTSPELDDALATEKQVIRVTFSERVYATGTGTTSALRPGNWTLTRLSTYAVAAEVVAVTAVSESVFDLTMDIPLTFGASYRVTAAATITDLRGNTMAAAPDNAVTFAAFNPVIPEGRRYQLWDFIPEKNKREDRTRDLYKFIHVLQESLNLVLHEIDRMADILDPDLAPEDHIDAMLADLGNPFRFDLDLADKRRLLGVLVAVYQLKGTKPGIVNVIQFLLGLTIEVESIVGTSWTLGEDFLGVDTYLGSSDPYTLYSYQIVSPVTLTAEQRSRIRYVAEYMQSAHEHLIRIVEPETEVEDFDIDHVELGYSALGETFILH